VGRISGFGLMEMSRQRLRPGMLESTTQPCSHCHGTGLLRSDDNVALGILRQLEEEGVRGRSKEVLIKAPIVIANFLMNQKREHIAQIEARYGLSVRIECDPHLVSPDFVLEKFKTASRVVAEVELVSVISSETAVMAEVDDAPMEEAEIEVTASVEAKTEGHSVAPESQDGDAPTKKRRRRRRRRRGSGGGENAEANGEHAAHNDGDAAVVVKSDTLADVTPSDQGETPVVDAVVDAVAVEDAPKPKRTRTRRKKADAPVESAEVTEIVEAALVEAASAEAAAEDAPKPKRTRSRRKKADDVPSDDAPAAPVAEAAPAGAPAAKPKRAPRSRKKPAAAVDDTAVAETPAEPIAAVPAETPEPVVADKPKRVRKTTSKPKVEPEVAPAAEPVPAPAEAVVEDAPVADDAPKKRGWWSLGR
jgi:ribonuclease E